jgi:hypothetical protein
MFETEVSDTLSRLKHLTEARYRGSELAPR